MQLEHSFVVPVGIEVAWKTLLDIEQVAPCMPGAALDTVDGDDFTGSVKVRLGPIGLTYKGKATFLEKDEAAHRAVIDAQGKDARGNGTAKATVTAVLRAESDTTTAVEVVTDLNITGKPAQFGRGVMVDVGNKLIGQFADCLAGKLTAGGDEAPAAEPSSEPEPEPLPSGAGTEEPVVAAAPETPAEPTAPQRPATQPRIVTPPREVEPIDLLGSAGPAVAKRLAPVAVLAVLILLVVLRRRRR